MICVFQNTLSLDVPWVRNDVIIDATSDWRHIVIVCESYGHDLRSRRWIQYCEESTATITTSTTSSHVETLVLHASNDLLLLV